LEKGLANLERHVLNLRKFGLPVVVAINHFHTDTVEEVELVMHQCRRLDVRSAVSFVFDQGGEGGLQLANQVVDAIENDHKQFKFLYEQKLSVKKKIETIAREIYGAGEVKFHAEAEKDLVWIERSYGDLPICVAKTQHSISDDPKLKGAYGLDPHREGVRSPAGAGFIVAICGDIMLIPGPPAEPNA
jgi:formate--tetrahydrofolate ligase